MRTNPPDADARLLAPHRMSDGQPRRVRTAIVDAVRTRVGLHGGIWGTYLAGAVAGGFAEQRWHFWAPLVPVLLLAGLAAAFARAARAR
jgi:uncharacterized membrane protein YoaK (UPF0700 family)